MRKKNQEIRQFKNTFSDRVHVDIQWLPYSTCSRMIDVLDTGWGGGGVGGHTSTISEITSVF